MKQTRSLFNLSVQEITFGDIKLFCEQKTLKAGDSIIKK